MIVKLYSLRCDEPLCRAEAELVGESLDDVEKRLVKHGRWALAAAGKKGGAARRHYCPGCAHRRTEQKKLDDLIRSL